MANALEPKPESDRELVLTRIIPAPREKLYRAWTEPELLKQWFAPAPYTTPVAELDVRPGGWEPSAKPFMTVILTFEAAPGGTRYTARVRHWSVEDRKAHEEMGFQQGWGQCADQLAALVAKL